MQKLAPTAADWTVLARLFTGESEPFRHHMGLARTSAQDFYASTAQAELIRAQKLAILASPDAGRYMVESQEGRPAFEEFVRSHCRMAVHGNFEGKRAVLLKRATLTLEPDWILLVPPNWRLACASVCFPTRWSLEGKVLQPLPNIHAVVPGLQQEIGRKIELFFGRMVPGEGWGRANWGLSSSANLNQHPSLPYTPLSAETPLSGIYLRVESQNLRKLLETGAIAFGIRILNFPLAEVAERPSIATSLKEQLRTMTGEVAAYKGIPTSLWERI